eukprot:NODE_4450_length_805_cov_40.973545_g4116_i0.p1 GENE.NODE_4450_length_805_cov_40.973545_g4116_i0~~NODE_4450_length_805_cov_40.973545_g4116_i0.p1  ORF type:complete len:139 (+),score=25.90 NODE_4450_length_805_cov_40.973545_g4116_i0:143-559(+)
MNPPPPRLNSQSSLHPPSSRGTRSALRTPSVASSRSITSTEALDKLRQLEAMLERERSARTAAEKNLETLMEEREQRRAMESQLQNVMGTLKELIGTAGIASLNQKLEQAKKNESTQPKLPPVRLSSSHSSTSRSSKR